MREADATIAQGGGAVVTRPLPNAGPVQDETTARKEPEQKAGTRTGDFAKLRVVYCPDGTAVGRTVLLNAPVAVGRDVGEGLCIKDREVSRLHCRVVWDAQARCHRVGDAGSTNGTFLGGKRVESGALAIGDVIRVGDSLLVYCKEDRMALLRERAKRAAVSGLCTLLLGETGTGKEILARQIHEWSGRDGSLIAVNCGGFARDIIAAELFGHAKGAFTGATAGRRGVFAAAEGGTLFLDELGELPIELQPMLLRAVQEHKIRPVGAEHEMPVDVRLVVATNVDLKTAVRDGRFRADLYARVGQIVLNLPPLRERRAQILELSSELSQRDLLHVTPDAAEALLLWDWPHNVRELKSLVQAHHALSDSGAALDMDFLEESYPEMLALLKGRGPSTRDLGAATKPEIDRGAVRSALADSAGNVSAAADALDTTRMQLYRWMKYYGISPNEFRDAGQKG